MPAISRRRSIGLGRLDVIYDPSTTRPIQPIPAITFADPFPGNVIPGDRINTISANVVKYYPLPNRAGNTAQQVNNYLATGKAVTNTDNYLARMDHNFSEKKRIFGRVGYAPYTNFSTLQVWPSPSGRFLPIPAHRRLLR